MFDNPILDHERIYIQDDLSYNFVNPEKSKKIDDALGGHFWSIISKMLQKITSFVLSYLKKPPYIESPKQEEIADEPVASKDSDIEILEEVTVPHKYPITNDYHLIYNRREQSCQNSILEESLREYVENSTTTSHDTTGQILRDQALKNSRPDRLGNTQQNDQNFSMNLSTTSPLHSTPTKRANDQPKPSIIQQATSTVTPNHDHFFDIKPKTNYQQSILNFYTPPKPISITSYSIIDDLITNFKIDRISETYKKAQFKTQELITAKRLAAKAKIKPLDDSQLAKVNQAWQSNPRTVCTTEYSIDITYADLQTLKDGHWLNDNVIDFYHNLIMKQNPKIFIWTTHFYSNLASRGYSGVARWAKRKKINLFTKDKVIVPVNISNTHWALALIDNLQKTITYYDSLDFNQSGNPEAVENLQMYMDNEAQRLGHNAIKYKLIPYIDAPQQKNGSDCGVFTCTAARYLAQDHLFNYSQNDMKVIRRRMVYEIMNNQLLR